MPKHVTRAPPAPSVPRRAPDDVALALVRRYYEDHGARRDEVHRSGDGRTVAVRVLVPCACPICADARATLHLED